MLLAPATRPESYLEIMVRSLNLSRHAFMRTLLLVLLFSLAIYFPRLICYAVGKNVYLMADYHHPWQLLYMLALFLATLWFLGAAYFRVNSIAQQRRETYIADFKTAFKKVITLFGAGLILLLLGALLSGFILGTHYLLIDLGLFQPGKRLSMLVFTSITFAQACICFYISMLFIFYFPLIVIENDKILRALKESAMLVFGQVWNCLVVLATPWLVYMLILVACRSFLNMNVHVYFTPLEPVPTLWPLLFQILLFALASLWSIATTLVKLKDLEIRKMAVGYE